MQAARNTIMKGTEVCSKNEDVWLEAIRLQVCISVNVLHCTNSDIHRPPNSFSVVFSLLGQKQNTKICLSQKELLKINRTVFVNLDMLGLDWRAIRHSAPVLVSGT